jgi:hypothetical protein
MQHSIERLTDAIEALTTELRVMQQERNSRAPRSRDRPRQPRCIELEPLQPRAMQQPSPFLLGTYDPQAAAARIRGLHSEGLSLVCIAEIRTAEGIPTRYGLPWQYSSVRHLFRTYGSDET